MKKSFSVRPNYKPEPLIMDWLSAVTTTVGPNRSHAVGSASVVLGTAKASAFLSK